MPFIQDQHGTYRAERAFSADDILAAAARIVTSRAVGERQDFIRDPEAAKQLFKSRLAHLEHEEFHVVFLDTRHKVIAVEAMFRGTVDGSEVHPREVIKAALKHNASAVLCAHNHPSGNAEPSAADRAVTARLKQVLALVDIRLLDHLIVADTITSLAARGWV